MQGLSLLEILHPSQVDNQTFLFGIYQIIVHPQNPCIKFHYIVVSSYQDLLEVKLS